MDSIFETIGKIENNKYIEVYCGINRNPDNSYKCCTKEHHDDMLKKMIGKYKFTKVQRHICIYQNLEMTTENNKTEYKKIDASNIYEFDKNIIVEYEKHDIGTNEEFPNLSKYEKEIKENIYLFNVKSLNIEYINNEETYVIKIKTYMTDKSKIELKDFLKNYE